MASSFWFLLHLALILPFMSSSSQLNSETSTIITASPALLANPPQSLPPYQELSPDISPLLPSPGGVLPSPAESSMPTIPSNPSPPNPDDFLATGPESAFSPFGSMPAFAMARRNSVGSLLFVFVAVATYLVNQSP
ncbi:hypothetical protein Ddye_021757 [Dipteronia dyeriana]|uniref:Classical arabinogalactan protein 25 n=1 Tax=Dipteronia dyeriana TaxID=168575 RepID=A0AAD9WY11_9ROSI|nr:hypothetical protein Ddye_021757 [Dipteronia dyeriana]